MYISMYAFASIMLLTVNIFFLTKSRRLLDTYMVIVYIVITLCTIMYILTNPYVVSKVLDISDIWTLLVNDRTFLYNYILDIIICLGIDTWVLLPVTLSMYVFGIISTSYKEGDGSVI